MPVIYNSAAKAARMTATRDYFAEGTLEIMTGASAVLATFVLTEVGGSVSGGEWTLDFDESTVEASGDGTAALARIKTAGDDAHLTGLTVGTSGADVILNNTSIATGQDVTLTSAKITHAPDPE